MTDDPGRSSRPIDNDPGETERCGRCGQPVESRDTLCPRCGALLDAYRLPVAPAPAPAPVVHVPQSRPIPPVRNTVQRTGIEPTLPAVAPELTAARERLVTALSAPERRLVEAIQRETAPATPPVQPAVPAAKSAQKRPTDIAPATKSTAKRPVTVAKPAKSNKPTKPGFVAIAPVAPVFLLGISLLVVAAGVFILETIVSSRMLIISGALLAAVGAFLIALVVLVMLVRHDREW